MVTHAGAMMIQLIPKRAAFLARTAWALCPAATAQIHQGVPPAELWGFGRTTHKITYDNGIWGRVEFNAPKKKLSVLWRLGSTGLRQDFATSYYPTDVIALTATRWCVAGKRTRGATVIELWTIQQHLALYADGGGGPPIIRTAAITEIETVYDEAVQGRDMVALMCAKREDPDKLLVQFWDSKDLYELDLGSQQYTRVATPGQVQGVLQVPALDKAYCQFWSREHVSQGFVYVLSCSGTSLDSLVLKDSDKDGSLDGWVVADTALWAQDCSSPANYVD
jgi:hypothetical protein